MRVVTLDPYIRRVSHYYLSVTLLSFVGLIIIFGYQSQSFSGVDSFMGSPGLFISKFVFLCMYMTIAIAMLFVYQVMLQTSNNFIRQLKRFALDSDHQLNVQSYTKKRNKVFTSNLFILLFLYILITNYGLNYDQVDYWLPAHTIMPILILVVLINFMTCTKSIRSSFYKIIRSLNEDIFQKEPQLKDQYWKLNYFYYNQSDARMIVNRRSGIGWSINHAHRKPAIFLYLGVTIFLVAMIIWT